MQIRLVVTCAPSLEFCYVFEIGTEHRLRDFGEFDDEGHESVRRWYKCRWSENTDGLVTKIAARLRELVREHLGATEQWLAKTTP
jgi:hypothetical protein